MKKSLLEMLVELVEAGDPVALAPLADYLVEHWPDPDAPTYAFYSRDTTKLLDMARKLQKDAERLHESG